MQDEDEHTLEINNIKSVLNSEIQTLRSELNSSKQREDKLIEETKNLNATIVEKQVRIALVSFLVDCLSDFSGLSLSSRKKWMLHLPIWTRLSRLSKKLKNRLSK